MNDLIMHETKLHGTQDFPYIVYHGKIPDFISAFPRHWHDEMELIYVAHGQIKLTVWSQSLHARSGDIVIILPHAIHSIEQASSEQAEYFNIVFHFSIFGNDASCEKYLTPFLTHKKTLNCYAKADSDLNSNLKPLVLSLINARRSSYTTHEFFVKSNLFMIMHLLSQHGTDADESDHAVTYEKLKTALYHVQNSYSHAISIQEAAALCGFSQSHFMKLFKELTGQSFTAYLIGYRLELAADQLRKTDLKVIEIAANCGFHNHSYFTRAFSSKFGMAPADFRKQQGGLS